MRKILVTGATGFLGSEFIEKYSKKYKIFAIYRNYKPKIKNISWIRLDLAKENDFLEAYKFLESKGIDGLVHIGGATPNRAYAENSYDATILGTQFILNLAKKLKIKKMIFISSISVTFPNPGRYAESKIIAEDYIKRSGINYTILRPETIIGPGALDFSRLAENLRKRSFFPIIGLGNNLSQPISSKDMNEIINICLNDKKTDNKTYSCFGKESIKTKDMLRSIARVQGNSIKLLPIPYFIAYPTFFISNIIRPKSGFNLERLRILSQSRSYNPKLMNCFKINLKSFNEMISFLGGC